MRIPNISTVFKSLAKARQIAKEKPVAIAALVETRRKGILSKYIARSAEARKANRFANNLMSRRMEDYYKTLAEVTKGDRMSSFESRSTPKQYLDDYLLGKDPWRRKADPVNDLLWEFRYPDAQYDLFKPNNKGRWSGYQWSLEDVAKAIAQSKSKYLNNEALYDGIKDSYNKIPIISVADRYKRLATGKYNKVRNTAAGLGFSGLGIGGLTYIGVQHSRSKGDKE